MPASRRTGTFNFNLEPLGEKGVKWHISGYRYWFWPHFWVGFLTKTIFHLDNLSIKGKSFHLSQLSGLFSHPLCLSEEHKASARGIQWPLLHYAQHNQSLAAAVNYRASLGAGFSIKAQSMTHIQTTSPSALVKGGVRIKGSTEGRRSHGLVTVCSHGLSKSVFLETRTRINTIMGHLMWKFPSVERSVFCCDSAPDETDLTQLSVGSDFRGE